jgi:hypothetical protein
LYFAILHYIFLNPGDKICGKKKEYLDCGRARNKGEEKEEGGGGGGEE